MKRMRHCRNMVRQTIMVSLRTQRWGENSQQNLITLNMFERNGQKMDNLFIRLIEHALKDNNDYDVLVASAVAVLLEQKLGKYIGTIAGAGAGEHE